MNCLFDLIESGKVKVRIMFTQNRHIPRNLSREQQETTYFRCNTSPVCNGFRRQGGQFAGLQVGSQCVGDGVGWVVAA